MKNAIIAIIIAASAGAALAQTTMTTIGNTTYINGPGGRTTTCSSVGNTVYCN